MIRAAAHAGAGRNITRTMGTLAKTTTRTIRCLILACGNTLRSDDGVGPWLAKWAEDYFRHESGVRVVSTHQWTPELAEDIAEARSVLFVDCSIAAPAGLVELRSVDAGARTESYGHHLAAPNLLALARGLFDSAPQDALFLTVGAGSIELGESFSSDLEAALPNACALLEDAVRRLLAGVQEPIQH